MGCSGNVFPNGGTINVALHSILTIVKCHLVAAVQSRGRFESGELHHILLEREISVAPKPNINLGDALLSKAAVGVSPSIAHFTK